MARLHSRKKGKSGSTRPVVLKKPDWCTVTAEEVEKEVIRLATHGESMAKIGLILRDTFQTPLVKVITGKKISQILKENNITTSLPEDMRFLAMKAARIRSHLERNPKDLDSKKGLQRTESKIHRLIKYYKAKGILDKSFKYKHEEIKILLR
jgi:small subunit ribosomal protein S15